MMCIFGGDDGGSYTPPPAKVTPAVTPVVGATAVRTGTPTGTVPKSAPMRDAPRITALELTPMMRQGAQQTTANQARAVKLGD